jgi:hypothetical protein
VIVCHRGSKQRFESVGRIVCQPSVETTCQAVEIVADFGLVRPHVRYRSDAKQSDKVKYVHRGRLAAHSRCPLKFGDTSIGSRRIALTLRHGKNVNPDLV